MENIIFQNLIKYEIPIIFVITHCQINFNKEIENKSVQKKRNEIKIRIENAIKAKLKKELINIGEEYDKFIENFVKFKYVNLVRNE